MEMGERPGHTELTAGSGAMYYHYYHDPGGHDTRAQLARLERELRDDDQLADTQLPNGVDGPVARLRGR